MMGDGLAESAFHVDVVFHVKQCWLRPFQNVSRETSFANAEASKHNIQYVLDANAARQTTQGAHRQPQ